MNEVPASRPYAALGARRLLAGFLSALILSITFMALTAYQSAATLFSRIDQTEVMKAASGAAISGQIAFEVVWFVVAQFMLHVALAGASWLLAVASAVLWRTAQEKFLSIVVGWFSLLAGASIAYNAYWFPRTLMGAYYHDMVGVAVGPWTVASIIYVGVATGALATLTAAAWKFVRPARFVPRIRVAVVASAIAAAGVVGVLWAAVDFRASNVSVARSPNVIIIGIDSLRLDQLERFGGGGSTPNLDRYLADADIMRDTTTPAARTFSSWMAILTGRSPVVTGARFNLAPRAHVAANPTIGDVLRMHGYKTVYSTDEVRFANIDKSFGFDQVITPRIGASDFLIGTYNELPLASVVINTRFGQWLFPFSFANRGVATMFQPDTYVRHVERELSFDRPTLFITHLTAAHWPYYVSDTPFGITATPDAVLNPLYRVGLETADRMFGEMLEMLRQKGALDNAIVVVLSDHGEAFGLANDTVFGANEAAFIEGLRAPIGMNDHGHGQSVLSPSQYKVLLSFRSFGAADSFRASGREWATPVTVEDIAPTILDLLAIGGDPLSATGQSLAALLRGADDGNSPFWTSRVRYTETDLAVLPGPGGGVDEVATARHNAMFFNVNRNSGRLELNEKYAPLATSYKERAAFTGNQLLAALPAGPYAHQYLLFDLARGRGQLLQSRPGDDMPEAQALWDGMQRHYSGELQPAIAVTREDWPRIDREWQDYYRSLAVRQPSEKLARDEGG